MATNSWKSGTNGDWNTATLWSTGAVPVATDDVVVDVAKVTQAYTVAVTAGETVTLNSLTLNAPGDGTNQNPYLGAVLQMNGTMIFAPGSKGDINGSLQSAVFTNSGTFINAGTVAPFIQGAGNVLFTGTNGFYVENVLQSLGTVIVDTKAIGELITNTLTDGWFSAVGPNSIIDLGGTLEGLKVDITEIQGPPIASTSTLGFVGWTELTLNGPGTQINEWNGTAYVGVETTLNDIGARGTLDVLNGRNYTTTQSMMVEAQGLLNLQAGIVNMGGLTVAGILQGTGTITNAVTNNGTISVLSGLLADGTTKTTALDIVGALSGTGSVVFDHDEEAGTINAIGGTLAVGSVAAGQSVAMNGDDTLVLAQPGLFAGTIDAKAGDKIILQGLTATSAVATNGTLVISNGAQTVATLKLAGGYAGSFTTSGSIVAFGTLTNVPPGEVALHGPASQYVIADDNGSLYVQDTVSGRDGTQVLAGVTEMQFTDGIGIFDPTGSAEEVSRLYPALLGRAPDVAGLKYWAGLMDDSHVPLSAIADDFTASPEFLQSYGSLSDSAFVNLLYQNVLGRPADTAGAQYWDDALASGTSRSNVALDFAESQENLAKTLSMAGDANNAEAYRLYVAALNRTPDAGGLAYWSAQLADGATPTQVAQGFVSSAEFQQDYGTLNTNDFLTVLYQNVLHRAPDAAGLQYWTGQLQQGASEASVLVGFSDSLENRVQTAGATHDSWVFIGAAG